MGEIYWFCKQREELWQRWIDACAEVAGAEEKKGEALRGEEQSVRNLLNHHMMRHRCGLPASAPEARETMLQMFAKNSGIDDPLWSLPTGH